MRLFIATELPPNVCAYLHTVQEELKKLPCVQTFTRSFHLTYQFLEEVELSRVNKILIALSRVSLKKSTHTLDHLDAFPNKKHARVIWIRITPPEPVVIVQKEIIRRTERPTEETMFVPHITLSRIKKINNLEQFERELNLVKIQPLSFTIESVKLVQSMLTPKGPLYKDIFTIHAT